MKILEFLIVCYIPYWISINHNILEYFTTICPILSPYFYSVQNKTKQKQYVRGIISMTKCNWWAAGVTQWLSAYLACERALGYNFLLEDILFNEYMILYLILFSFDNWLKNNMDKIFVIFSLTWLGFFAFLSFWGGIILSRAPILPL